MKTVAMTELADPGEDLAARVERALACRDEWDFVHVHTKAPDTAAHTKDPQAKGEVIAALDRGLGRVIERLLGDPELLLAVTSDHSTPSGSVLIHSGEPVPLVLCGEGLRRDRVEAFDEVSCAAGCLGLVRGREFMDLVLNHLDRIKLRGIMDTPRDQAFWPGPYRPFRVK
jgi:2,3-bisphosphoglycerate-independent phosphoglycerate mutase